MNTMLGENFRPLAGVLAAALCHGCGFEEAKYPEGSQKVYCTSVVDDCDAQAKEQCPQGYTVLRKETWTTDLASRQRGGGSRMPVRHTSIRIMCASSAAPQSE
jgi:hypothetical protein